MITVEKVQENIQKEASQTKAENQELIQGTGRPKRNYWPYVLVLLAAAAVTWLLLRKKGSSGKPDTIPA